MEIINQMGHIQHWGLSPATNILKHNTKPGELKIIMTGCIDIRNILKTLCDVALSERESGNQIYTTLQFYFHETNKETLARALLFLHILQEIHLNFEERLQLYLDLYGNALIKERNARYLHNLREDLLNFIHGEKVVVTPIKKFVSLKLLRFEQIDEMSQFIQSWSSKTEDYSVKNEFDMQKCRDQKLRYLYKERYDYRANLVDWDYNMLLIGCAPIVHYYHYKEWRLNGLAFQQRFSTYCVPNRTLASYAEGKKKKQGTSCLVRGYWGDIVISPYIAMGIACDYKQADLLFKKANYKYIGHAVEITQYNMISWMQMIETGKPYGKVFRDYYRADSQTRSKLESKEGKKKKGDLKEIKEEEETKEEGSLKLKESEEKQEQKEDKQLKKQKKEQIEKELKEQKEEVLDSDEEEQRKKVRLWNSKQIMIKQEDREVLNKLKHYNVRIHLMGMNGEKLITSKFKEMFDVMVVGFVHSAYLNKSISSLLKKDGLILTEKATYLIPKKPEERQELNSKISFLIDKDKLFQEVQQDTDYFIHRKL